MNKRHFLYVLAPLSFEKPDDLSEEQMVTAAAHFDYVRGLHAEGTLVIAGRTDGAEMGIVVIEAEDEAAARDIMNADPAVRGGLMSATLYPYRLALLRGVDPE
jgi:uncharacterized protein YciI